MYTGSVVVLHAVAISIRMHDKKNKVFTHVD